MLDRALAADPPGMREIEILLSREAAERLPEMADMARRRTLARFGRVIQMYAPLYLSNACVNICRYCGFSLVNPIRRRTLSVEEAACEWETIRGRGFRHLLLVSGEDFREVSVDYLCRVVERLRPTLSSLSVEVAALSEADYRRLVEAGIDGVVLYQETYDRTRYGQVHPKGPKRDYDDRLEAPERAASAGVRKLGMGALLGLAGWRREIPALVDHVRQVRKRCWRAEVSVSVPRLRPAAGGYEPAVRVSDRDLEQIVCALRLALPDAGIVLSTREGAGLRDRLVVVGVTQMSAGSVTDPGGYTAGEEARAGEQFEIADHRTPAEVAARLRELGYEPVWKDWEPAFGRSANPSCVMGHVS